MSVKIGDRVRFLNDVGGGIVTEINSNREVIVEQEDGFGFPVLISECVVIEPAIERAQISLIPEPKPAAKVAPKTADTVGSFLPKKPKTAPKKSDLLEVDLHIDKLLDTTAGMSSGEMLEYQLEHFKKVIAQHENQTGKKIIFIHGKGEGVLRNALERELRRMGRGDKYQEASFQKYSYGAIMVII